ncbi:hypothetical protein AAE478_004574 [Parahypoxylon ruwenzoriense]
MSVNIGELQLQGRWAGLYTYPETKTDGESDFTVYADREGDKFKIHGEGQDKVGPFSFSGHVDSDAKVKFKKSYATYSWQYSGSIDRETNMMHGRWGEGLGGWGGYFAFHLADKSDADAISAQTRLQSIRGNWSGNYTTKLTTCRKCSFSLTSQTGRNADQLTIHGDGTSPTGQYRITGIVSLSGQVIFAKIRGQHVFLYRGVLTQENNVMEGRWAGNGTFGTFRFEH